MILFVPTHVFKFSSIEIISEIKCQVIRVRPKNDYVHEVPEKVIPGLGSLEEKLNTVAFKKQIVSKSN